MGSRGSSSCRWWGTSLWRCRCPCEPRHYMSRANLLRQSWAVWRSFHNAFKHVVSHIVAGAYSFHPANTNNYAHDVHGWCELEAGWAEDYVTKVLFITAYRFTDEPLWSGKECYCRLCLCASPVEMSKISNRRLFLKLVLKTRKCSSTRQLKRYFRANRICVRHAGYHRHSWGDCIEQG